MEPVQWLNVDERLAQDAPAGPSPTRGLRGALRVLETTLRDCRALTPDAVLEQVARLLQAEQIQLFSGGAGWSVLHAWPQSPPDTVEAPVWLFGEALERPGAAIVAPISKMPARLLCSLDARVVPNCVLVLTRLRGRFQEEHLEWLAALRPALSALIARLTRHDGDDRRISELETLLDISRQMASARDTATLLEYIAVASTRLLRADRASVFVWDRANKQMVARPALGVSTGELRLPDDFGIVGSVLHTGEAALVNDVHQDPRFGADVDAKSGYRTHNLLCVPMVDLDGQRIGAFEVLNKQQGGFTDRDRETLTRLAAQVAVALQNTREIERLVRTNDQYTREAAAASKLIGPSAAMAELRATILRVAPTDLPVLILGDSGTGKEVVARALHHGSKRFGQPFIAVNCAALAETLLESELFGHEKGSFTDAHEARAGKFELANGGTLFLDEIGDMSASGQAKLLRVLEEKSVYRVGGSRPIHSDARVVAATNRNLVETVRSGKFREDLFYRLTVVTLQLSPLRDRRDDILPLAEHFLDQFCRDARRKPLVLSPAARARLAGHEWPGNVRELRNLMERVAFLCPNQTVEPADLSFSLSLAGASAVQAETVAGAEYTLSAATDEFQRQFIQTAIDRTKGNLAEAGRLLGLHRSNLYRKMRQLGMNTKSEEP